MFTRRSRFKLLSASRGRGEISVVNRAAGHLTFTFISAAALLSFCVSAARGQTPAPSEDSSRGSLSEVSRMRRVVLLVSKLGVTDAYDPERVVIEKVMRGDPRENKRHGLAHNEVAHVINGYIRRYKSLRSAGRLDEADFIVFFNVLGYRRILYRWYSYGELYVIAKGAQGGEAAQPRIVWKSKKVRLALDAARELIKELKSARGEG